MRIIDTSASRRYLARCERAMDRASDLMMASSAAAESPEARLLTLRAEAAAARVTAAQAKLASTELRAREAERKAREQAAAGARRLLSRPELRASRHTEERAVGNVEVRDGHWHWDALHVIKTGTRADPQFYIGVGDTIVIRPDVKGRSTNVGFWRAGWYQKWKALQALAMVRKYAPGWLTGEGRELALGQRNGATVLECQQLRLCAADLSAQNDRNLTREAREAAGTRARTTLAIASAPKPTAAENAHRLECIARVKREAGRGNP